MDGEFLRLPHRFCTGSGQENASLYNGFEEKNAFQDVRICQEEKVKKVFYCSDPTFL